MKKLLTLILILFFFSCDNSTEVEDETFGLIGNYELYSVEYFDNSDVYINDTIVYTNENFYQFINFNSDSTFDVIYFCCNEDDSIITNNGIWYNLEDYDTTSFVLEINNDIDTCDYEFITQDTLRFDVIFEVYPLYEINSKNTFIRIN